MIRILKASAGSGKTWNLAKTYIRLLLENDDPAAYRHVLAVTFTNKATDEMKRRILKELHTLATAPEASGYFGAFVPALFPSEAELEKKAGKILSGILHDYGAFAVSTIDRFFQQTLKAFSREIGQFATYQVELDRDSLVEESVDRLLDALSEENTVMLKWLSDSVMEQLGQGMRFNLEGSLKDMAKRLKSDEYRAVVEEYGIDEDLAYSKENLRKMKTALRKEIDGFAAAMKEAAQAVEDTFRANGVSTADTSRGFLGKVTAKFLALRRTDPVPELTETFRNTASDFGSWFRKADRARYTPLESALVPPVQAFCKRYDEGVKTYNTARILSGQINDLGIAADLHKEFAGLMKEKNVLCLDDSNVLLKRIIDGSDAPFVYEKMGVRFEHFLLDEFQDTSRVQWDNFRPLIANSDAEGFESLLVGDVKQSIYRWRGSDWKLMAREVQEQFRDAAADSLKGNYRSLRTLVAFNNGFFEYAAGLLDRLSGTSAGTGISSLYGVDDRTLAQAVETRDGAPGFVEVLFCAQEEGADAELLQVYETVMRVEAAGAAPGDVTILVRNNREGADIARYLMDKGVDVISDDSLHLKSSPAVRRLVSLISCVRNPDDTIGSYLAREAKLDPGKMAHHSLVDLCEQLLRLLKETGGEAFDRETLYIQSFMDYVQDHAALNGNALDVFLKAWNEADPKVSSPADTEAVRVMTVHKAKGLEFPYVVFPYLEKVGLFRSGRRWTVPDVAGTALEGQVDAAFDVQLSSRSASTLFEKDYRRELLLQYIDNINTFYVALTRASKGMTLIARDGSGPEQDFSGILRAYLEENHTAAQADPPGSPGLTRFRIGEMYDFSSVVRDGGRIGRLDPGYPSWPLRGRLLYSKDSSDFFSDDEDSLKPRQNGIVLHGILASVVVPEDLPRAVENAFLRGDLDRGQADRALELLSGRIAGHPEWFPRKGGEIRTEVSLIDTDGGTYRPDRVVIQGGTVTILDYKFGQARPDHREQVDRYAQIYRRMGFKDVRTAVWYVPEDRTG